MSMAENYLRYIVHEIHTTIVATVDDEGLPVTAAIDMMDADENGLYFLTARGKGFYDRLKKRGFLALTALKGEDTVLPYPFAEKPGSSDMTGSRNSLKRTLTCTRSTQRKNP